MNANTPSVAPSSGDPEVMASLDYGREERLIIADVSCDDAWVSSPTATTVNVADWQ